jgi:DNA-directed RNA polymerase subunit RPC12/RpoP
MGKIQPKTQDDGYWIWFLGQNVKSEYPLIKGKYLFFHENVEILQEIAREEISNNGFELAKVNKSLTGNSTEHVLCLYYRDDSRKQELAEKYQDKNGVKYRYWKSDEDTRQGKYSQEFLDKMKTTPQKRFKVNDIKYVNDKREISIPLCEDLKPLKLLYELSWRTKADEKFLQSPEWKRLREAILKRDDYTCSYCGHKSLIGMQVNHIDGNPKNNDYENLEVICSLCHMITHSGLWCVVKGVIDCYAKSKFNQNEIIQITRALREDRYSDEEIIKFLQLKERVPWQQDLGYLSMLYGFITSRPAKSRVKPHLTEKEQKESLKNREKW